MSKLKTYSIRAVSGWAAWCYENPLKVIGLCLVLTIVCAAAAVRIKVSTDTAGMISPKLRYIQVYHQFKKEFPLTSDNMVVVIKAVTPDLADIAADRLFHALQAQKGLFSWLYLPAGGPFFEKNGLLFLDTDQLEELSIRLSQAAPFLALLRRSPDSLTLFEMLERALKSRQEGSSLPSSEGGLSAIFKELSCTLECAMNGRFYQFSWQRLFSPQGSTKAARRCLVLKPKLDYGSVLPAKRAIEAVRQAAAGLHLDQDHGISVSLTGDIPMEHDELISVTRGAKTAGILSFVMVALVLTAGLGSARLVLATIVPLIMGLIWTAAFASAAIGHLNMISVAFTVLFIGLSVDYAIHLCLRYRELIMDQGLDSAAAMKTAAGQVGPSLLLCCLTTASAFYSFTPTDFAGVAELGIIAGTGILLGLAANLSLIPALLALFPLKGGKGRPYYMELGNRPAVIRLLSLPYRYSSSIRMAAVILLAAGAYLALQVEFDSNPINLRDQDSESVRAFKRLLKDDASPWSLEAMSDDRASALELAGRFEELPLVRYAVTLESFIPKDQDEKLDIIEETATILEPILYAEGESNDLQQNRRYGRKELLKAALMLKEGLSRALTSGRLEGAEATEARRLVSIIRQFAAWLKEADDKDAARLMSRLDEMLFSGLGPALDRLAAALSTEGVGREDLPPDLVRQWIGTGGKWRIQIVPVSIPSNDQEIEAFISQARRVDPDVTGFPVQIIEGGNAVVRSFKTAFALSFCFISAIIMLISKKKGDGLVVIFSLLATGILTGALMELFGLRLNFANIIALPLIMGIGVDHGIHIVDRFRLVLEHPRAILQTSTARAILFSSLTTICSFGNLAVSPHAGMASMGKLLTLGIVSAYVCAVILVPAFLVQKDGKQSDR